MPALEVLALDTSGPRIRAPGGSDTYTFPKAAEFTAGFTLKGSSSGVVTVQPAAAAGTYTLTMPTSAGSSGQVLQTDGNGVLSWVGPAASLAANTFTATQTITPAADTNALAVSGYSLTGSNAQSMFDLSGTWNTTGTPTALKLNVTDTASAAGSLLLDLQLGGNGRFNVRKDGRVRLPNSTGYSAISHIGPVDGQGLMFWGNSVTTVGGSALGFTFNGTDNFVAYNQSIGWTVASIGGQPDAWGCKFWQEVASTAVGLRDRTNAQTFRVYGTYTDASNFTRLALGHNGTRAFISEQIAGTGVAGGIAVSAASLSGSQATSLLDMSQTWNTSGTPTALKLNITDTASNASSLLMDLQVNGNSVFSVGKTASLSRFVTLGPTVWATGFGANNGNLVFIQGSSNAINLSGTEVRLASGWTFGWSSSLVNQAITDTALARDAADTLAQRRATNPQTFRLYNTFTDASNYERGKIAWSSNVLQIGTEKAGTGTARALELQTDGTTRATISATAFQCTFNGSNAVVVDGANGSVACRSTASNGFNLSYSQLALGEQTPILFRDVPGGSNYTGLFSVAAGALEQRNGTNAQTFQIYNTFTNSTNYERLAITWSSNVAYITPQNAGTGSARIFVPVTGSTTVAGLPAASTAGAGARAFVTDANATTFLSTVAGGGANKVPVVSDGTNWLIG